jgi:hypothetical protein
MGMCRIAVPSNRRSGISVGAFPTEATAVVTTDHEIRKSVRLEERSERVTVIATWS